MTDFVRSIIRFHPTMRVDFSFILVLKSNYIFFFMFISPELFYARGLKPPCNPVELHNCLSHNSNKCNPYAGTNNYHCLGFPSRSKHSACRPLGLQAPVFYRLGHPPSFHSGVFPTAVINYFALYSEAGSLPRLKLRTAYAFFAPRDFARPEIR